MKYFQLEIRLQWQAVISVAGVEVFTAVTMKRAVFWDIKTQFLSYT
jgi:hypothetical protein